MALNMVRQRPISAAVIGDANRVSNECWLYLGPSELDGPFFLSSRRGGNPPAARWYAGNNQSSILGQTMASNR